MVKTRKMSACLLMLGLVFVLQAVTISAPPPGIPDGWSNGYVYANGIRIHYYRAVPAPGKPVIVMVHGVTDNGLCWTTLTWKLQDDYDVYMLDTRSHGLSDPITTADDADTLIKDVVEFVKAKGFEKPILMGHSMGGATVIRVGAEYPDLAKAIVVLDAGIGGPGGGRGGSDSRARGPQGQGSETNAPPQNVQRAVPPRPASAPDRLSFSMHGSPEMLVAQNNYNFDDLVATCRRQNPKWDIVDCQYWALSKKQYHGAYSNEAFREVMQGSMRTGDSLAKIPVPMIILKADASPEQRKAHLEAASVMQKGKLVHIDGAGHNLHHDELERTAEVLTEFLSTLFRRNESTSVLFSEKRTGPFSIGADISFVEGRRAAYRDNGVEKDICQIMADRRFDTIRLRIFVNPEAEGGYSRQGACGLDATVRMAKRIKAAGMNFALDFHYSDTWADPDKQFKPSAWKGLTGKDLENALYEYTKTVLTTLKGAGAAPDVVQIGNEINHGMVWPDGRLMDDAAEENWQALMNLYKAGQRAVRQTLPDAKIMIHLALGGQNTLCREFLDQMNTYGAQFDLIGLSYYEKWHETYDDLKANLYDLAERYQKPLCVCEYGANKDNIKIINDIVRSVPDGLGYGTMAWEPVGVLFSRDGNATEIFGIYETLYEQYSDPTYAVDVLPPFVREFEYERPLIGADISWVPSQEDRGTVFSDQGVQKDVLEILNDNKFNWIRLRLFVDPTAENGYSRQGYCDLDQTLAMAKRIKAAGMKFLLNFHYSDTWADPGKQFKPASWARFTGSALEGQVYQYTHDVVKRFIAEGVKPDMVQVGNEIQNGMIWPQGKIENIETAESFCVLLRCASAGVRAADPSIKIMVHIACGGQNEESVAFFDKIISRDVKFDVIGQSYYPEHHGTLEELQSNLNDLATRYKKPIVVVEYQEHRKEVNEIVKRVPNGLGWGTFIWEATTPRWGNLFDRNGATNENMAIYPEFFENYNK